MCIRDRISAHRCLQAARRKLRGNPDNSTARPRPYGCCTGTGRNSNTLRRSIPVPIFHIASKQLPPATLQCFGTRLCPILGHACAPDKRLARRDSLRALESYQTQLYCSRLASRTAYKLEMEQAEGERTQSDCWPRSLTLENTHASFDVSS